MCKAYVTPYLNRVSLRMFTCSLRPGLNLDIKKASRIFLLEVSLGAKAKIFHVNEWFLLALRCLEGSEFFFISLYLEFEIFRHFFRVCLRIHIYFLLLFYFSFFIFSFFFFPIVIFGCIPGFKSHYFSNWLFSCVSKASYLFLLFFFFSFSFFLFILFFLIAIFVCVTGFNFLLFTAFFT